MAEEEVTREVFRNVPDLFLFIFYGIVFVEIIVFSYGFFRLFRKYRKGKSETIKRTDNPIKRMIAPLFGWQSDQRTKPADRSVFISHMMVVYGMIVLFIGTVILTIDHDIVRPLFPEYQFFHGTFYKVYSFCMDIAGIVTIAGLINLGRLKRMGRLGKTDRLDYSRVDGRTASTARQRWKGEDAFFLISLFIINITGFILEGIRITADMIPDFERASFFGYLFANIFDILLSVSAAEDFYVVFWWFHMLLVSLLVAILPYTKGMHIVTDYFALATQDSKSAKRLPGNRPDQTISGYGTITDLTWRDLLSLDACTKCGRCHISCPAQTVGQPLSPRDVILDLREHASLTLGGLELVQRGTSTNGAEQPLAIGDNSVVLADTIWSCTTCRACVSHCPVAIEHVPLIVQMRRRMVEEGDIDPGIQGILEKTGKYGNSFGKSNRMRARWTKKLGFPVKDARKEEVDLLWFVGDFASFDARAQEDTILLAQIFHHAGVDFGLLYEGEKTSGNDIRRIGEEGLFEMLVEDNLKSLNQANFKRILTTDPHSLNTLRNEYPEFDGDFIDGPESVLHYTHLLWDLIDQGHIVLEKQFTGKVTYHDPCYLGRYAGEYDAPRNIIMALGFELIEMPRSREDSFCCGAGGGMIFLEKEFEGDRPAPNRIREAATLNVDKFIVTCPKDKVMFGDAVKVVGESFEVIDLIKLVHEALPTVITEGATE
ncbi:MAG: heterodisulfide reductase-related iron-sulfur binding cluster [Candidatus Kariarchaeaceae archaeon]|jgi:Fe-S oxidoreductase/nitrate reductase gamma subunit